MKTTNNIWLLILMVGLLLAALILRNWKILAITIPLITFLALTNLFLPRKHNIFIRRIMDRELVYEGEDLPVKLFLENKGPKLDCVEIYDTIPSAAEVKRGSNHFILNLEPGEKKEVEYTLICKRIGNHTIGPVFVRNMDFLGSYIEDSNHSIYSNFSAIPYLEEIKKIKISPKRTRLWLGNILSKKIGMGSEFYSLDEYHVGDELRRVNWKASSRYDRLYVNEYEAEKSGDVIIMLDARQEGLDLSQTPKSLLYYEIKAALSIAAKILHERNRVGLIVQRDVMDWIYLGCSKAQFYRILHNLLKTEATSTVPFEYTAWIVKKCFPPQTQIIIISPLTDRKIIDYVIQLRAFKYDILIISPCPLEAEKAFLPQDNFTSTALKILRLGREIRISELRRFASVVDWNVEVPLIQALRSVKISKPLRI